MRKLLLPIVVIALFLGGCATPGKEILNQSMKDVGCAQPKDAGGASYYIQAQVIIAPDAYADIKGGEQEATNTPEISPTADLGGL